MVSPERPEIDRGHLSPSWSVRLLAAPRSVGPVINLGFPITHNKDGPSWSVRLLAAPRSVGPIVIGSNNTLVPPAPGRSSQCGTRGVDQNNSAHQFCRPMNFANVSCSSAPPVSDWSTVLHLLTPSTPPQNPSRKPATRLKRQTLLGLRKIGFPRIQQRREFRHVRLRFL